MFFFMMFCNRDANDLYAIALDLLRLRFVE